MTKPTPMKVDGLDLYTVIYVEPSEGLELWQFFECYAEEGTHAEEQCQNAYPSCNVLWVNLGKDRTMEEVAYA